LHFSSLSPTLPPSLPSFLLPSTARQLETWLKVVFSADEVDAAQEIGRVLAALGAPAPLSASALRLLSTARKRGPGEMSSSAPSWMGSTTTANRAKKSKLSHGSSLSTPAPDSREVGFTFLRLDLEATLSSPVAVAAARKAVKARLKFEAWAAGKMAEHELEEKRLIQERADFRMLDVQGDKGAAGAKGSQMIQEINMGKYIALSGLLCRVVYNAVLTQCNANATPLIALPLSPSLPQPRARAARRGSRTT
jgi:hypothetical protein